MPHCALPVVRALALTSGQPVSHVSAGSLEVPWVLDGELHANLYWSLNVSRILRQS